MIFHVTFILAFSTISMAQWQCYDPSERYIDGACFTLINQRMSFYDAEEYCKHRTVTASNLAIQTTSNQMIWLTRLAQSEFGSSSGQFWIGVYRPSVYENFQPIVGKKYLSYQNFRDINPSMNFASSRISNGFWDTKPQEERLPFICGYVPYERPTSVGWLEEAAERNSS